MIPYDFNCYLHQAQMLVCNLKKYSNGVIGYKSIRNAVINYLKQNGVNADINTIGVNRSIRNIILAGIADYDHIKKNGVIY